MKRNADKATAKKAPQAKTGAGAGETSETRDQAKGSKKAKGLSSKQKEHSQLVAQLKPLLKVIDENGLRFLIRQAQVLIRNQQVDKINDEIDKQNALQQKRKEKAANKPNPGATSKKTLTDERVLDIEEGDGQFFVLVLGSNRKMLSRDEMANLVRISHLAETKADASARMFNWLSRNRQDIIYDLRIKSKQDARLAALATLLKNRYKAKA